MIDSCVHPGALENTILYYTSSRRKEEYIPHVEVMYSSLRESQIILWKVFDNNFAISIAEKYLILRSFLREISLLQNRLPLEKQLFGLNVYKTIPACAQKTYLF